MSLNTRSRGVTGRVVLVCGAMTAGAGTLTLVGWTVGWDALTAMGANYIPMAPNTALLFVLLGSALLVRELWPTRQGIQRAATAAALLSVVMAGVTLLGLVSDLNIDNWLFRTTRMPGAVPVGRMSSVTAFCFAFAGVSLLLLNRRARTWAAIPSAPIVMVGVVCLMGYAFGAPLLYGGTVIPVALPTSLALVTLGVGLIAATGHDSWPLKLLSGSSTRARLLRTLLPTVVILALINSWITSILLETSDPGLVLAAAITSISFLLVVGLVAAWVSSSVGDALDRSQAERRRVEEIFRASEEKLRSIFDGALDGILVADKSGEKFLSMNPAMCRMLGYKLDEIERLGVSDIHPQQDLPRVREQFERLLRGETQLAADIPVKRKDGSVFYADIKAAPVRVDGKDGLLGIFRDITERRDQERKVARLSRIHAVMSSINSLIVRVRDRQELFNESCRIAVEHGGFGIVWISILDPETLNVNAVAWAGIDSELVKLHNVSARGDVPEGQGAVGRAIREKRSVIVHDFTMDSYAGRAFRKEAMSRGYRSLAAFPLLVDDSAFGALALFAKEPNFFTDDELKLFTELAGDISFALQSMTQREKLDYLAYYDALTGLPNRALLDDRMTQVLRAASHDDKSKVALVLIDLQRFRALNDTLGRGVADELLKLVAQRLQSVVFDRDSLGRIHADVFAGLFPGIKDEADIARIVEEKIIGCLSEPFTIAGQEMRVSAKAGVALFPVDATEPDALFSSAEAALRQAKASSERYLFYAPKMNAQVAERLKLENKLQRALERDEFVLFYQPKVDFRSGGVTGLEALIRWNDPETGLVPPMLFIPLLEETGMIVEVGAWAMQRAVSQYAAWQAAGLPPLPIAVNLSQVQLRRKDFVAMVRQAIALTGKPDHGLDFEVTESMIMEDIESSIEKLKTIRELGVGIAIDDFGTGHSSLRYLTRLPLTALKIDRAFIQDMTTNADDVAIASTIIALGRTLNLKVIAEGVETEEQSKFLRLLKCDEMQGYLFSKPVPAEQIPALIMR